MTFQAKYDLTGQRFGRLMVESRAASDKLGLSRWNCVCQCGTRRTVQRQHLRSGHTSSCGCARGRLPVHGMKNTPTHNTWCAMKQRCQYEKAESFEHYGGRGIKVCQRWDDSFEAFLADMGPRPPGKTINRRDNDGDYEPGNCFWATDAEQAKNRRSTINVVRDGVTMCVSDWCKALGLNQYSVYGRIRHAGATPEDALEWAIGRRK